MLQSLFILLPTIVVTIGISALLVFVGSIIYRKSKIFSDPDSDTDSGTDNHFLEIGTSFFIGLSGFLVCWMVFSHIVGHARSGLIGTLILFAALCYVFRHEIVRKIPPRTAATIFALVVLFMGLGILQALVPMPRFFLTEQSTLDPFLGFGGVSHGFRAGNISEYILQENRIPIINQNIGQSMLESTSPLLGLNHPHLSLVLWFNTVLAFSVIFIYGFVRKFVPQKFFAIMAAVIVVAGNNALYFHYVSLTDGVSTLLLAANIDSIIGIITFLLFLILFIRSTEPKTDPANSGQYYPCALVALFTLVWSFTAGQNILLAFPFFACLFFLEKNFKTLFKKNILMLVALGIAIPMGITQGGMLTPTTLTEKLPIPGLMQVERKDFPPLALKSPEIWQGHRTTFNTIEHIYTVLHSNSATSTTNPPTQNAGISSEKENVEQKHTSLYYKLKQNNIILRLASIERFFRAIFFPLLGLLLASFLVWKKTIAEEKTRRLFKILAWTGILTFGLGLAISSSVVIYGYSFETTKFLYFGNFLAKLLLGISFGIFLQQWSDTKMTARTVCTYLLVFVMVSGPVLEFVVQIVGNFTLPATSQTKTVPGLSIRERLGLLVTMHGTVGGERKETKE